MDALADALHGARRHPAERHGHRPEREHGRRPPPSAAGRSDSLAASQRTVHLASDSRSVTRTTSPLRNMSSSAEATWSRIAMYRSPSSLAPESVRACPRGGATLGCADARPACSDPAQRHVISEAFVDDHRVCSTAGGARGIRTLPRRRRRRRGGRQYCARCACRPSEAARSLGRSRSWTASSRPVVPWRACSGAGVPEAPGSTRPARGPSPQAVRPLTQRMRCPRGRQPLSIRPRAWARATFSWPF